MSSKRGRYWNCLWGSPGAGFESRIVGTVGNARGGQGHDYGDGAHFGARELTVVQRWTQSEDGKRLTYSHEIRGPGKMKRHETEFEI